MRQGDGTRRNMLINEMAVNFDVFGLLMEE